MNFSNDSEFDADAERLFKILNSDCKSSRILSKAAYTGFRIKRKKILLSIFYNHYAERLLKFQFMGDSDLFFQANLTIAAVSACKKDPRIDWNKERLDFDPEREYFLNLYLIDNLSLEAMFNNVPTYKKSGKMQLILSTQEKRKITYECQLLNQKKIMTQNKKIA